MCDEKNETAVQTFDENGKSILPACADSAKCSGVCKTAQLLEQIVEVNENVNRTISLRPTLIINGEEKPFQLVYRPIDG